MSGSAPHTPHYSLAFLLSSSYLSESSPTVCRPTFLPRAFALWFPLPRGTLPSSARAFPSQALLPPGAFSDYPTSMLWAPSLNSPAELG